MADTERADGFGGHCPILAASIAIGLIFANFVAGNLQPSIDAVGRGQMEAGQMLGFSKLQTMRYIVLPQALRIGMPLSNSRQWPP